MQRPCFVADIAEFEPMLLLKFIQAHLGETVYFIADWGDGCIAFKRKLSPARLPEDSDDIHYKWAMKNIGEVFMAAGQR